MKVSNQNFLSFRERVESVFDWSIEPVRRSKKPVSLENTTNFFKKLYISRDREEDVFREFIHSDKTLMILTGHVGAGKSTFIREKYQNSRMCPAITVDFTQHEISEFSMDDLKGSLQYILAHRIKDRLEANFAYASAGERCKDSDTIFPEFDIGVYPERKKFEIVSDDKTRGRIHLCAYLLSCDDYLQNDSLNEARAILGDGIYPNNQEQKIAKFCENIQNYGYLKAQKIVLKSLKYREWIRAYQLIYPSDSDILIVLDNTDVLDTEKAGGKIYSPLLEMTDYLNHWDDAQIAAEQTLPNVKFVFAVRDENIALISTTGRLHKRIMQISLGPDDYTMALVKTVNTLQTTDLMIASILERRVTYLRESLKEELSLIFDDSVTSESNFDQREVVENEIQLCKYFEKIISYWFEESVEGVLILTNGVTKTNIIHFNNRSIRHILQHICATTLDLLDLCIETNVEIQYFDKELALMGLRGRTFRAAWSMPNVRKLDNHLRSEFRKKLGEPYISLSRLILTYLANLKRENARQSTTPSEILAYFQRFFHTLTLKDVKELLYTLYESSVGQGELISIRQKRFISSARKIAAKADVGVMLRGIEMLDNMYIQIDFFGEMAADVIEIPSHKNFRKVLAEMDPVEAENYIKGIFNKIVEPMSNNYQRRWIEKFCPRLKGLSVEEATKLSLGSPFEEFVSSKLAYSKAFFITRCCASHRNALKSYLWYFLNFEERRFLLSNSSKEITKKVVDEIKRNWSTNQVEVFKQNSKKYPHPVDDVFETLFKTVPKTNPLKKIWVIASERYPSIENKFLEFSECRTSRCKFNCN